MDAKEIALYLTQVGKAGDSASNWAYTPDKESPSTWKLNISDAVHVGGAVAALGAGFRGRKVQIPSDALAGVKAKVKAAWRKFHPDAKPEDIPEVLKGAVTMADEKVATPPMTVEDLNIKLGEMETQLTEANKRADRLEAVAKLSPEDRTVFEKLAAEKQDEFLKADAETRKSFYPKEPEPDPVLQKRLDDIQKDLDKANARAEAAEGVAKVERDARLKVEFQKQAEATYPSLPGTPVEKGAVLQTIHSKLSKEEAAEVEKLLAAGDAALKQLGKSTGTDASAGTGGGAWEKIETMAKSLVAADTTRKLTMPKAITKVCSDNPALYDAYNKEKAATRQ